MTGAVHSGPSSPLGARRRMYRRCHTPWRHGGTGSSDAANAIALKHSSKVCYGQIEMLLESGTVITTTTSSSSNTTPGQGRVYLQPVTSRSDEGTECVSLWHSNPMISMPNTTAQHFRTGPPNGDSSVGTRHEQLVPVGSLYWCPEEKGCHHTPRVRA